MNNDTKKIVPFEKKTILSINKELDSFNNILTTNKDDKNVQTNLKNIQIKDDNKDKDRIDRNMNSLINIGKLIIIQRKC